MKFRRRLLNRHCTSLAVMVLSAALMTPLVAQENAPPIPAPAPIAPAEAVPMDLEQAIAYAFEHNPQIAGAAAEVRAARARVGQAKAVRHPQVGLNGQLFHDGPSIGGSRGGNPIVPDVRWSVGVFLSQILFDWGQRAALQRSAEKETNAATLRVGESRNNVRLVVS